MNDIIVNCIIFHGIICNEKSYNTTDKSIQHIIYLSFYSFLILISKKLHYIPTLRTTIKVI